MTGQDWGKFRGQDRCWSQVDIGDAKMSPTDFVSNIRHQHRYSQFRVVLRRINVSHNFEMCDRTIDLFETSLETKMTTSDDS